MKPKSIYLMCALTLGLLSSFVQASSNVINRFQTDANVIMVGDVHGAYPELVLILRHAGLIDENLDWQGGDSHFISTGDLMDRGPSSRKIMDLLIKLQDQATQQNGRVHVLLGNHEVLNLTGDWRYISAQEYQEFATDESAQMRQKYFTRFNQDQDNQTQTESLASFNQRFPAGFFARLEAFMPDGVYGSWLHTLPFIIKVNQHVFTHGGLSVKTMGISIEQLNDQLTRELKDYTINWQKMIDSGRLAAYLDFSERFHKVKIGSQNTISTRFLNTSKHLLFSMHSPNWYRGNAFCHPLFEAHNLNQVLAQWQASTLWVGHTTERTVRHRFDDKLILMDTGMLNEIYQGQPIYAKIYGKRDRPNQTADWQFINARTNQPVIASSVPDRKDRHPFNFDDGQIEQFLLTATITETRKLGEGITNPLKVTLEKDDKTLHAVFKHFDSGKPRGGSRRGYRNATSDRYVYDVAAYKLDRLMGLQVVPVAVERKVNGTDGALQLWIDGLINYKKMSAENIGYDGFCDYASQRRMMNVFDYLIHNEDRNQSNITFTMDDWQLWFIDHTRSFSTSLQRPKLLSNADLFVTEEFRKVLAGLDHPQLSVLSPYLSKRQIDALLKRRDRLLNYSP